MIDPDATEGNSSLFGEEAPPAEVTPVRIEGRDAAGNRGKPAAGGSGVVVGSGAGAGGGGNEDPDTDVQSGSKDPAT